MSDSGLSLEPKKEHKRGLAPPLPELIFPRFMRDRLGRFGRPLGLLLIILILGGSGVATWALAGRHHPASRPVARFQAPVQPFQIVSTAPARDQKNVSTASTITMQFNEPVDPSKLQGNFFVTPMINGQFSQGKTPDEAIFTPDVHFAEGTKVQVMINGTFQSAAGSKLGANYFYSFTTSIPDDGVIFENQNLLQIVDSAPANQKQSFQLDVGTAVSPNAQVALYKSDMNTLLQSLAYTTKTVDGSSYQDFISDSVDTGGLTAIDTKQNIKNGDEFDVNQGNGVYLAVATDGGSEVGHVWIVYSDFGLLVKQDDQKVVLNAQHFDGSGDVSATAQFYNLNGEPTQLGQTNVDGLASQSLPYTPQLDAVVASDGTSQAIAPVSILDSLGDIRNEADLSRLQKVFGLTDRPTYLAGDEVRFAGFARTDDDAQYSAPAASLDLYAADSPYDTHLADLTVPVSASGAFSGQLATNSSWLPSGQSEDQIHIYAKSSSGGPVYDADVASFSLESNKPSQSVIKVKFGKSTYLPASAVSAGITATNSTGEPVADAKVTVHIYAKDYYEDDSAANLAAFDGVGTELAGSPYTIQLNSSGKGTVNVDLSKLPDSGSQIVTVQAGYKDNTGATAAGGDSATIHQGNGYLEFGPSRTDVAVGDQIVGRVYAKQLDGSALPNAQLDYKLVDTAKNTTVATGTVGADSNGYAVINQKVPATAAQYDSLELDVSTGDSQNDKITASNYYYVTDPNVYTAVSGAELQSLDVSGSSTTVAAGSNLNLVINSPANIHALVTMDRGRIYNAQMLDLKTGDNKLNFTVGSELAPSFTLTFSYFLNGQYSSEGVQFNVSPVSKQASLSLSPAAVNVAAGESTTVTVSAQNANGNPLKTGLIVGVVDANAYNLYDQVVPDMFASFYAPRVLTTSSSSSLSGIGSGGGGCGGGGPTQPEFTNPIGSVLLWQPGVSTDASGKTSLSFKPPKGSWRIYAYSMNSDTVVGGATADITAN